MKHLLILCLLAISLGASAQWTDDILGNGYQQTTIIHPDDYSGRVVSTVIRRLTPDNRHNIGILYIHGYND